jgi:septum formation protein
MLLLASQSPRRRALLQTAGYAFRTAVANTDESYPAGLVPSAVAEHIAIGKANALAGERRPGEVLLAADTVVAVGDTLLAKPADAKEAAAMLRLLSGREHAVITGVCLLDDGGMHCFHETTVVTVAPLTDLEVQHYIATCKPFDKAGGYAIQEWIGMMRIPRIAGCYYNVVGLPMPRLSVELAALNCHPILVPLI